MAQQKQSRPPTATDKGEKLSTPHPTGKYDQLIDNGHGGFIYMKIGRLHREDGPAVSWLDGTEMWYFEGKLHRDGGPAVTHPDGRTEDWNHGVLVHADPTAPTAADAYLTGGK